MTLPISLKQLRYAVTVAQTGHFGRAAELCSVTQPALSQQIGALEARCGTPVFDRLTRGIRLTPFGEQLIDLAQATLVAADRVSQLIETQAGQPGRPVRFGMIPTVAPYLLPTLFPALTDQLPQTDFAISENRTGALLDGLADGALDLALIASEPRSGGPRLTIAPLFRDDFVLATAPDEHDGRRRSQRRRCRPSSSSSRMVRGLRSCPRSRSRKRRRGIAFTSTGWRHRARDACCRWCGVRRRRLRGCSRRSRG